MSLTLILMRHVKSSWDHPGLSDFDRPLSGRGEQSAQAMGAWLRAGGWHPDEVLSSSSLRTRETFAGLGFEIRAQFLPELYHAEPGAMWDALHQAGGRCVLMLGHNPGIADFAASLVAAPPKHARFDDFPTCATLVARFDTPDWLHLQPRSGHPVAFAIPREIIGVP